MFDALGTDELAQAYIEALDTAQADLSPLEQAELSLRIAAMLAELKRRGVGSIVVLDDDDEVQSA